jgi:voltage-gated sodium channel
MTDATDKMIQTDGGRGHRAWLREFLERTWVQFTIQTVIIINAILMGIGTSDLVAENYAAEMRMLDRIVISIFVFELSVKLYAYGLSFFRSAWNIFDFVIVGVGLLPTTQSLAALRALRVIRALRILSVVPQMKAVVQALLDALPGMGAVVVILGIVYYIFAVMATIMYGPTFDEWFGSIGSSMYSLFQIMTLESWSMGIVRPVMREFPFAWAFFVPFIMVTTFAVVNLLVGLIVNSMQEAAEGEKAEERDAFQSEVLERLSAIEKRMNAEK